MTAIAEAPASDVRGLVKSFSAWVDKSATKVGRPVLPVFSLHESTATLDAVRASNLIRTGIRAGSINDLVALLGLSKKEELVSALNTTGTSLWRWAKDDKPLPGPAVEQILRVMQLQFFAAEVFGTVDLGRKWLHKPHPSLEGIAPIDFADNEFGAQKVRGMLAGLKYGGVA